MMSAENIALAKIAIELCHNPKLKGEILCASGSTYVIHGEYSDPLLWDRVTKEIATRLVRKLGLSKDHQEKVLEVLLLIANGMLKWAVYHEDILGLSREQSMNALNSSIFTQQGLVDNKKAAMELMKMKDLSIRQLYKLACLYCFKDHILALYGQMTEEVKEEFYDTRRVQRIKQPGLVTFWSYFLAGEIDKIRGEKPTFQYMLETAVQSGSRAGVEWCLETANSGLNDNSILDAAIEAVRNVIDSTEDEYFLFQVDRYDTKDSWVPHNYFIDILCFLLSKMSCAQQMDFFKRDIEVSQSSSVVGYFLDWPYQNYFMKTANVMWELLPEESFSYLMERISNHCKEKTYDYNKVFRDFWCNSPEHYKRYFFSNKDLTSNRIGNVFTSLMLSETGTLTNETRENILLVLADASKEEKEQFISHKGAAVCMRMIKEKSWKVLDEFIMNCVPSEEQADIFKRDLSIKETVMRIFLEFVKYDEWNAVESFLMWSSLNEEEINVLKKNAIYSTHGREACAYIITRYENIKSAEKFIRWSFTLEKNITAYKKEFAFSCEGISCYAFFIIQDKLELLDEFVNWSLSFKKDIKELKKKIAYTEGPRICKHLISNIERKGFYGGLLQKKIKFEGSIWKQVEIFLTWAFSSAKEIIDFKKGALLEKSATDILFSLVKFNQWEKADFFLAWIGLSLEQTKQLKKETIFNHQKTFKMFLTMVYTKFWNDHNKYGFMFKMYGSKRKGIDLFLRWFLTDKETVLEFKNRFRKVDSADIIEVTQDINQQTAALKYFILAIDRRLNDLNLGKRGVKRNFGNAEL